MIKFIKKIFNLYSINKDSDIIFSNPAYNNEDSILEVRGINSKGDVNYYKCYNTIDIYWLTVSLFFSMKEAVSYSTSPA